MLKYPEGYNMADDKVPTPSDDEEATPSENDKQVPPPLPPGFTSPLPGLAPPLPPGLGVERNESEETPEDEIQISEDESTLDSDPSSEIDEDELDSEFPVKNEDNHEEDEEELLSSSAEEEELTDTPLPLPLAFNPPPPPPGMDSPPPPPPGMDSPPPPPPGMGSPPLDELDTPFQLEHVTAIEDEITEDEAEIKEEENQADILSIDSLADSLSLLRGEWTSPETDTPREESSESTGINESEFSWPEQYKPDVSEKSEVAQAIDSFGLVSGSEEQQFGSSKASRPSPFLRQHSEVDSIPGDKLHATLSETERVVLNPDGSIRKQFIDGELILRNSSKKHRAWDIEVHLESIESTDFGDKVTSVKELDPTDEAAIPYTASGPRMLVMREKIDTEATRDEEPSLSLVHSNSPQDVEITIEIENVSPGILYDVEVKRQIPGSFILPDDRVYSVEGDTVVWDIGRMNVGASKTLSLSAMILTESVSRISAGVTSATYSAEATVSRARFDRVHGSGRQFSYVNAKEDDRPGVWHCKCVFENKSSFVVALSGATVKLIGRDKPILDVSDIRQDVPPEGRWDSMSQRVESDDQPSFTQEIRFSILPRVSVQSTGTVELKEQQLTVLDAVLQKRYDKSRIKSYVSSKIDAVVTLENTGTSEINVVRILDDIPGIFETPSADDISIEMEGSGLSTDQYRIDVVDGIQIEEKYLSPDNDGHGLRVTVGTSAPLGLQPGKTLIIRYPLEAPDPSPRNKMLAAPIKVDFSSERFGPVATRMVERPPRLRVVHKRRNISTGKEVFPGGKPGQYEILLMFNNNSDSALDDLALHDVVPGTFSIEGSVVKSDQDGERDASITKESARDGTQVTWAIGRILQDERVEVLYTIQGDPEAEYKVTDAQDFHGATFGDEVDEEPNIPEWLEVEKAGVLPPPSNEDTDGILEAVRDDEDSEASEDSSETEQSTEPTSEGRIEEGKSNDGQSCPVCSSEVSLGSSICQVCGFSIAP